MPNSSRRVVLGAGLGLLSAGLLGCTKAVQAVRSKTSPASAAAGSGSEAPADTSPSPSPSLSAGVPPRTVQSSSPVTSTATATRSRVPTRPVSSTSTAAPRTTAHPKAAPHTGPATQIASGPTNRHRVALTFHGAGDIAYAREILAIVKRKNVKITVMVVGTWLVGNPAIGREILAGGHEIGNHTLSHLDINSMSETDMRAEVRGCRDALMRTAGVPGSYFRQSQSQTANALLRKVAGDAGYAVCLSYDVDSLDWTDPGAAAVRHNMLAAKAGSIVSMHLGHSGTVEALPGVLDDLAGRGLSATTVSTLLAA